MWAAGGAAPRRAAGRRRAALPAGARRGRRARARRRADRAVDAAVAAARALARERGRGDVRAARRAGPRALQVGAAGDARDEASPRAEAGRGRRAGADAGEAPLPRREHTLNITPARPVSLVPSVCTPRQVMWMYSLLQWPSTSHSDCARMYSAKLEAN